MADKRLIRDVNTDPYPMQYYDSSAGIFRSVGGDSNGFVIGQVKGIGHIVPVTTVEYNNIGSLSASASWDTGWIDLQDSTDFFAMPTVIFVTKFGVISTGENLAIQVSGDGSNNMGYAVSTSNAVGAAYNGTSGGSMVVAGHPTARYIRVKYNNGSTAQTALYINLRFANI